MDKTRALMQISGALSLSLLTPVLYSALQRSLSGSLRVCSISTSQGAVTLRIPYLLQWFLYFALFCNCLYWEEKPEPEVETIYRPRCPPQYQLWPSPGENSKQKALSLFCPQASKPGPGVVGHIPASGIFLRVYTEFHSGNVFCTPRAWQVPDIQ